MDVVFIHGLTGDPKGTWLSEETEEYWPEWLCKSFPEIAVYAIGYPGSLFAKWAKKEMDPFERAANYGMTSILIECSTWFDTRATGSIDR